MAGLGSLDSPPQLACAVSGGADSLALLLLLDDWVRARGGRVLALTVDHRLRPEAATEARWVGDLCAARGIAHRTLVWDHGVPAPAERRRGGPQAAARDARYRLLGAACREAGLRHLALAHHQEDQAETFLLRLTAGSGPDGLAAMPAVAELEGLTLLRPLLTVPKAALVASLRARGQTWCEDPSNRDPGYTRVRLRRCLPLLAELGLPPARLAETARLFGRLRAWREGRLAELLARTVRLHPAGFAVVDITALLAEPAVLAEPALARVLRTVGGSDHLPRSPGVRRLLARLAAEPGRRATLGGCRLLPRGGQLTVVREPALAEVATLVEGAPVSSWDGRFAIALAGPVEGARGPLRIGPLGEAGWAALVRCRPAVRDAALGQAVPMAARAALPAIRDLDGLWAVPHFKYCREVGAQGALHCTFRPRRPLTDAGFTVPRGEGHSIRDL